jgi:hypothetical protein
MSGSRLSPSPINLSAPSGAELSRWFATGLVPQQARAAYWAEIRPTVRGAGRVLNWRDQNLYNAEVISALEAVTHRAMDPDANPETWFLHQLSAVEALEAFGLSPCGTQGAWQHAREDLSFELGTNHRLRRRLIPLARKARATASHGEWVVEFLDMFERS